MRFFNRVYLIFDIFSCNVALLALPDVALNDVASECSKNGVKSHVIECDLSSKQAVEDACKQISQVFENKLDILINNAGISGEDVSSIEEKAPSGKDVVDMWKEVMMVNLVNLMRLTGRCLPMMKKCKHGAVITISSLAATVSKTREKAKPLTLTSCSCCFRRLIVTHLHIMLVNGE